MKSVHDRTRELLPDYLNHSLSAKIMDEVEAHLKGCEDCRTELFLLSELSGVAVPDPGDTFWKTLAGKIISDSKEQTAIKFSLKSFFKPFLLPFPIAATAVLLALLVLSYWKTNNTLETGLLFEDPLATAVIDYSDVTEKDLVPDIGETLVDEEYWGALNFSENFFYRDFVLLNSEEMDSFNEILQKGPGG